MVLCATTLALARAQGVNQASRQGLQILYIGNSLTTTHNIPALVQAFSRGTAQRVDYRTVAFPNYSLQDHWNRGDAGRAIEEGGWSFVVLQQGPSALPESRRLLRDYTYRFDAKIRKVGGRTALYMVWPAVDRRSDFPGVELSYETAAREVGGLLLPVGEAWRAAWRRDAHIDLYAADGLHPSPLGAYVAALVIYQKLSGNSPVGLPTRLIAPTGEFAPLIVPPGRATVLQTAAAETNARFKR